ncbi:MAG: S9 family peptidase [Anaerolineales bacterium]|nr:S9 family peptidase [Anaerolineales bacterium]
MDKLQISDLISYKFPYGIQLSSDGTKAAFLVKQAELEENCYFSDLYICRLDSGRVFELTSKRKIVTFDWSSDGEYIHFVEWGKNESTVYQITVDSGEIHSTSTLPGQANSIRWLDDRRMLFIEPVDISPSGERQKDSDCLVVDELAFFRDGYGYTNKQRRHLFLFDAQAQECIELTGGALDVEAFDVHGERIVLSGNDYDQIAPLRNDLYLLNLDDRKMERLTDRSFMFHGPRFITENVVGVLGSDIAQFGFRQNKEVIAFNLDDRRIESLTPGWDKSVRQQSISTDLWLADSQISCASGGKYYCVTTERDSAYLNAISLNGEISRSTEETGAVYDFDVKNDTVVYAAFRNTHLPELYTIDNGVEKQLTALHTNLLTNKLISNPEYFTVTTEDGVEIDAWLIRPVDYQPGKRYPAILKIHGGPKAISSSIFFHELQALVNAGYAVFTCNPRGSDGRGDAFHSAILGNFGTIDYDDIMTVVDHAIQYFDFIDPERLGVTGPSYGGYLANWIIGHTHRFKAAVSVNGISNLVSMIGTTEIGYYWLEQYLNASPWDNPDKYWFHSPLRYADQVDTPTLFLQSEQDYVCGIGQGFEMFTALKKMGVDTRLCIFQDESHAFMRNGKPKNKIRYLIEMLAWFDAYLQA